MKLLQVALALVCWVSPQIVASVRVAVLLTDAKMDDKAAVAVTLLKRDPQIPTKPQYDRVVMVFTGVSDRNKIANGMVDYLVRAEKRTPAVPNDWRTRTGWLQARTNIMGVEVPHERWYMNLRPQWDLVVATGESLAASVAKAGQDPVVDIFQIAPYEDKDIWEFIDALPNINVYHLFYGYNSRQGQASSTMTSADKKALADRQNEFHGSLQRRLTTKHGKARLIFTQNPISFSDAGAGSQALDWCTRFFPLDDVMMALSDPFWTSMIREANSYADEAVRLKVPADEDEFLSKVVDARLNDGLLRREIHRMLQSAAQSKTFEKESQRTYERVASIVVKEFSGTPAPTVELGDANHVTAVLKYLDDEPEGLRRSNSTVRLLPAMCDMTGQNPVLPPNVEVGASTAGPEDGWVLTGCNIAQTRKDIEHLF